MKQNDYEISNIEVVNSPALMIYPSIVKSNIKKAIKIAGKNILRPHIKTCKTPEVIQMMMDAGITHFKCATIAEAELLGIKKVKDVLLAYQPVAVSIQRFKKVMEAYPETSFSCLIDNNLSLEMIAKTFDYRKVNIFIDVNVGMNRTGVAIQNVADLMDECIHYTNVEVKGVHAYDGDIDDVQLGLRSVNADCAYNKAVEVKKKGERILSKNLELIIGGTPTFPIHAKRHNVQCSPGTFIFWDYGYSKFTDLPFTIAAVLVTRIISIVNDNFLCLDLGHKAVASENPLHQRLRFLNIANVELIGHSEEHLVVRVKNTSRHKIGDVWYAAPYHICPTVALYNEIEVIENGYRTQQWKVIARNRKIDF
jgi:D-threonine aldolase